MKRNAFIALTVILLPCIVSGQHIKDSTYVLTGAPALKAVKFVLIHEGYNVVATVEDNDTLEGTIPVRFPIKDFLAIAPDLITNSVFILKGKTVFIQPKNLTDTTQKKK